MKHILLLALQYLRFNRVKTLILVFSIAAALFLPLALHWLVRDYERDLLARAQSTPLVAGAVGSRLDLVLHALYFRGKPARDLSMKEVDTMNKSGLALAIPILGKDTARGFPIVGTTLEYFDFRGLHLAQGSGITRLGDCVLGAAVSEKLRLQPGERLMSDSQNVFDLAGAYPLNMRVKGILAPAGSADDNAVFVDLKTEWLILGIVHGHQEAATVDPSLLISRNPSNITASAALLPFQEVTETNLFLFHLHGDSAACPVSAILAVPPDDKAAAILRGRYQDPKSSAQLLVPRTVVAETLDLIFRVKRFFDAQSVLVGAAMGLLLTLVFLLSYRLRQGEMETMFKLGCARKTTFCLVAAELIIVSGLGTGIAVVLSWLLVARLGLTTSHPAGSQATTKPLPSPQLPKRVGVVNYPLAYFAHRICGDQVEISFPVPRQEDPAFWKPSDTDIESLQRANLIFLNGAEYEKWLPGAVLPLTKQIVTSAAFGNSYITNGEIQTHTHGPQGMHSHGQLDFNTWLDPQQAALQAVAIHDELVRLVPTAAKQFDENLKSLRRDLEALDSVLGKASAPLGNAPLLGSHPVYQYVARRYGWNLRSVHWEPDQLPSDEEWGKLEELHQQHPARLMVWEAEPLPAVARRLREMGIEPVTFQTCANQPAEGDYITTMNTNAARLATALKGTNR